ncbi:hypothetical protein GpartN1_g6862.t1 [Galdieria partita]|uniref:Complex 1 LYR protein domain-containing protein n=1 Tax=Galdieria partita TaxID=83374 RepID=A0A9C7UTG9_9RHOD|nr:hypothetical protein GpartN1_g6862.t1 [Galdieria partita]
MKGLFQHKKGLELFSLRRFSTEYDYTGGTGRESSGLSTTEQEARERVIHLYRYALKSVPDIRKNYRLNEGKEDVALCIRDLFERHRNVQDRKLIDMLVFKGRQDIDEVRAQWKGRHQILNYLRAFEEKKIKERAQMVMEQHVKDDNEFIHVPNAILAASISHWKKNKLIPEDISTPKQFRRWKEEEEEKFAQFAVENGLFTREELQLNRQYAKQNNCGIM